MSPADEFRRRNTRKASILQVGGFRPTFHPAASNFGMTPLGNPGEAWPEWNGKPLLFVCQMNLSTAPAVPEILAGVALLTFFIDPELGNLNQENGTDWVLRTYASLEGLVRIEPPASAPKVKKGFECRWEECEDHPNRDDSELVKVGGGRHPRVGFDNVARTKVGGYATTIQSEPWWGSGTHSAEPRFCVQINSEEKAGVIWGDGGAIYLARGTAAGCTGQWFLDWQQF